MKKKILLLIMVVILATVVGCGKEGASSTLPQSSSSVYQNTKYETTEGEIVIDDETLTKTTSIDDNYRVFYEIFTGSFSDSNNDGIGDLQGIINKLDYLNDGDPNSGRSLGVEGIWLTPIFKSPTYHKYDVTDYYTIDPSFGTTQDLVNLIEECHKRDIKIIIDLPINHTCTNHVWFENFANAQKNNQTDNPYYDFYSFYKRGETCPSGRSFATVAGTDTFYECNFSTNMPELNYDNDMVREEVLNVAKYYIGLGIDGFRFDAAKYIYYGDNAKSAEFWNWYVSELKLIKEDIYTVGEVWDADPITDTYYENGLSCFNFTSSQADGKISQTTKQGGINAYTKYVENYVNKIKGFNPSLMIHQFIANHDTDRAAGYLDIPTGQAFMAASLYLLSSGSPFIYYGEEIGMKGSRGSASTDANRRLAMLWGDDNTIKDPTEATYKSKYQTNGTVASQIGFENSLLTHYKKLIMMRKANPEIARGEYKALNSTISKVGGFTSTYNDKTVCVIHNTSNQEVTFDLSKLTTVSLSSLNSYSGMGEAKLEGNTLTIAGYTTVILR